MASVSRMDEVEAAWDEAPASRAVNGPGLAIWDPRLVVAHGLGGCMVPERSTATRGFDWRVRSEEGLHGHGPTAAVSVFHRSAVAGTDGADGRRAAGGGEGWQQRQREVVSEGRLGGPGS